MSPQPPTSTYAHPVISNLSLKGEATAYVNLGNAQSHWGGPVYTDYAPLYDQQALSVAAARDTWPLPSTSDREGYHGERHLDWWVSGLVDARKVVEAHSEASGTKLRRVLELGCASGRVLRHFPTQFGIEDVWGCDLNARHVDWVRRYLPPEVRVFQNMALPTLPLEDNSFDAVCAFSVFTHIDDFELAWLAELRRILRPGGIAYITVHTDHTWKVMRPEWPIRQALSAENGAKSDFGRIEDLETNDLPGERVVFWWEHATSYNADVFHSREYLLSAWQRIMSVRKIELQAHNYQDVVILQK